VNLHLKGESGGVGGRVKMSYWSSHSAIWRFLQSCENRWRFAIDRITGEPTLSA
jgi:hypothetical protein